MASQQAISQKLLPEYAFHIFNSGLNSQAIFFKPKNYFYFLKKYADYTKKYINTYAYCLLPNHFHFLVTIKSTEEILTAANKEYLQIPLALQKELALEAANPNMPNFQNLAYLSQQPFTFLANHPQQTVKEKTASWIVSNQLRRLFLGYAKAINKQEGRRGSLMTKPFKRKLVDDENYFIWLVWYLHRNPMHHKITHDFQNYSYSSYKSMLSNMPTLLQREQVFTYFDGRQEFIQFHKDAADNWREWQKYIIE